MANHGVSNQIIEESGEDIEDSHNTQDMEALGLKDDTNLNKMTDKQVAWHKKKMGDGFNDKMLRPGDEGWSYDLQKEFVQDEDNEWDESGDFADEDFDGDDEDFDF